MSDTKTKAAENGGSRSQQQACSPTLAQLREDYRSAEEHRKRIAIILNKAKRRYDDAEMQSVDISAKIHELEASENDKVSGGLPPQNHECSRPSSKERTAVRSTGLF